MENQEDILRRGRLSAEASKETGEFHSSVAADTWILPYDVLVDKAHTAMLAKQGIIGKKDAAAILQALDSIGKMSASEVNIPAFEDVHMAIESRLIKTAGENVGGRMHSGRSRNDEVITCVRMATRDGILSLMADLIRLRQAVLALASENTDTVMPGFTHLQHAQPTTLAHHMLAHASALDRDFERLLDAYKYVNINPLGSAAFASTGFPLDREYTTRLLGFDRPMSNSMDGVSTRDFILTTISAIAIIEMDLSRMADELVLWSTTEFNFIELSDAYSSTSSIMPQKKNPDILEIIRGRSGAVIGHMVAAFTIVKGLPYSYNNDLQEVTPQLMRSLDICSGSMRIMAGAIDTLTVNKDEMARKSSLGFTTATEIADTIVRATGLPFRTAHGIVGRLARGNGDPTMDDADMASMGMIGKKLSDMGLTEKMLSEAKDPLLNVERRNVLGGPAQATVKKAIILENELINSDRKALSALTGQQQRAQKELTDAAKLLSG
jgi:argininosuccinate lyase